MKKQATVSPWRRWQAGVLLGLAIFCLLLMVVAKVVGSVMIFMDQGPGAILSDIGIQKGATYPIQVNVPTRVLIFVDRNGHLLPGKATSAAMPPQTQPATMMPLGPLESQFPPSHVMSMTVSGPVPVEVKLAYISSGGFSNEGQPALMALLAVPGQYDVHVGDPDRSLRMRVQEAGHQHAWWHPVVEAMPIIFGLLGVGLAVGSLAAWMKKLRESVD
jgi:hypothetical protein